MLYVIGRAYLGGYVIVFDCCIIVSLSVKKPSTLAQ